MNEPTVTAEQINDLRQRHLEGKPWTRAELKDAITAMIGQRLKDVQSAAPKKGRAPAKKVDLDDLL